METPEVAESKSILELFPVTYTKILIKKTPNHKEKQGKRTTMHNRMAAQRERIT